MNRELLALIALTVTAGEVPDAWTAAVGIPVNVLMMALVGSLLGLKFAPAKQIETRKAMIFGAFVNWGVGASLAVFAPTIPGFSWLAASPAPVRGLLSAFACQIALWVVAEELPRRIREFKLRSAQ